MLVTNRSSLSFNYHHHNHLINRRTIEPRLRRTIFSSAFADTSGSSENESVMVENCRVEKNLVLFVFGFGYSAIGIANELMKKNTNKTRNDHSTNWSVYGTSRSAEKAEVLRMKGFNCFKWSNCPIDEDDDDEERTLTEELAQALLRANYVLVTCPPNGDLDRDPVLSTKAVMNVLNANADVQVLYLSSTGVYGGRKGEWVCELTEPKPDSIVGQRRFDAEEQWRKWAMDGNNENSIGDGDKSGVGVDGIEAENKKKKNGINNNSNNRIRRRRKLKIFRLGGIYGPSRSAIDISQKRERERLQIMKETPRDDKDAEEVKLSPSQISRQRKKFTSRIHVCDVARAIVASIERSELISNKEEDDEIVTIYNVVDDYPSSREEAVDFAAELLGYRKKLDNNDANGDDDLITPPSLEEKRVKNDKVKKELNFSLKFPTFKHGLSAIHGNDQSPFD